MILKQHVNRYLGQCLLTLSQTGNIVTSLCRQHLAVSWCILHHTKRTMSTTPQLVVQPEDHLLIDEKLNIKITGLRKHQKATLHATICEGKSVFESCSCFTADEDGQVDLDSHPSLAGSYTGVSPMGIFWSMEQAPGQREGLRLMKKDMDTPMTTNIAVYNDHLSAETVQQTSPEPILLASVDRWYKARGVKKEVVRDGRIRGILFLPPGDGPFPGVIDLFGTAGGILEFRSALLASRGLASLSLPYFRYEDLPVTMYDLDLEYFMEAIDWLCSHKDVYHDGIGAIGVSKGADIALLMSEHSPKMSCAVCINGCPFLASYPMQYKDNIIPYVPLQLDRTFEMEGAYATKDCLPFTKEDLIPVWRKDTKILNIIGEDDQCSDYNCIHFMKEHYPPEKKDNYEIVSYPKAGHLIEPPYTPLCRMSYHKTFDMKFLWGGYPEPHAVAQEDSWRRILEHFHNHIPKTSNCDLYANSKL